MSVKKAIPSYQEELKGLVSQLENMLPAAQLTTFNEDATQLAQQFSSPLQLKVGDQAPNFMLPNASGKSIRLQDMLAKGKVILTFYRGTWCPYCNLQLKQYQDILAEVKAVGANLMAISPQNPDNSLDMQQKNELEFEVLSDAGNVVARQYTTVFKYGDAPLQAMKDLGFDFHSFYSDDSGEIPVPATFIIDQDGKILMASSEGGDYRLRTEATAILEVLKA